MKNRIKLTLLGLLILVACKHQEKMSTSEKNHPEATILHSSVPEGRVKKSKDPIPMSACRAAVMWVETGEGDNSCVVKIVNFLGTGSSYAGLIPKKDDLLLVHELTGEYFTDQDTLRIDLQPFLNQRDSSDKKLPEMSLIQILTNY